jgi:FkbM family methyltransferase
VVTALDAGCGIGFFSNHLAQHGLKVTGIDARAENVAEAKSRYPGVDFRAQDVEDPSIRDLGSFDLVLCYGLLYHLENPFRAVRNLYEVTGRVLLIESLIAPYEGPLALLADESQGEDQALRHVAFIPTEACLVKMLYRAGFPAVYRLAEQPDHEEFRETLRQRRRRTVIAASKIDLRCDLLQAVPEPRVDDVWCKSWAKLGKYFARFRMKLRAMAWAARNKFIPQFPLPVVLPFGGRWLAWNDTISRCFWFHDRFEEGEQIFLLEFLRPGMTVLDIGAHQGLYSVLAARRVGSTGQVIAFEPSPRELRRLRVNLTLNRCRNVRVESVAVSDLEGTADLFVCLHQETGCNSLCPPAVSEPTGRIPVRVTTLDRYLRQHGISPVDVIKLDVEGAELSVLKGATQLLNATSRPVIVCEIADARTVPWGYHGREIVEFLEAYDYGWFSVLPEGNLEPCQKKEQYHENLIAVPREKVGMLADFLDRSRK